MADELVVASAVGVPSAGGVGKGYTPIFVCNHAILVMSPCMVDFSRFAILAPVSWGELSSP